MSDEDWDESGEPANDDVSHWIRDVQNGDEQSIAHLWDHCFPRLLAYARGKLPPRLRATLDEEDVALSTFKSFCMRARDQSLGPIEGRDSLWRLLHCIASRKAAMQIRHLSRKKRGGSGGESATEGMEAGADQVQATSFGQFETPLDELAINRLTPEDEVIFADQCQHLLQILNDDHLETVALLRMEGMTVAEIASKLGCARRSVERRLNMIRTIWGAA